MTVEEFRAAATPPQGLGDALLALWWDARGDWDRAHTHAMAATDADGAWVHAHLHRREGDLANADYWYARAGRRRPQEATLEAEWAEIAAALLGRGAAG
jgi:hypothetical protein